MIKIIKGSYGMRCGKSVKAVPAGSDPIDLDKDKGEYVAKADVVISIQNIVKLIEKGLDTIPGRYTSRLLAETRRITDHEFTDEERTVIRSHLKNVASEIMKSLQVDIKNLIS